LFSAVLSIGLILAQPVGAVAPASGGGAVIKRGSEGRPDWGGIWQRVGGIGLNPTLKPGQIDRPELTPQYQAMYDASLASLQAGKPDADTERSYMGYSVGRWDGDELDVTTTLFKGVAVLNQAGLTLSDEMTMHDRWKQTGADTLTDTITLTDAKALRSPYIYTKTFKRAPADFEIMEYTCVENNRNPILPDGTTGTILQKSN
jgi:hypothetical protein